MLEPAGVAVDQARVHLPQRLVVDAEALGRVVAHVVLHDVGPLDEAVQDLQPLGVLEVDRDAALAAVAAHRDVVAHPIVVVERVHLDDGRAEVGEQLGAERAGDREAEVQHEHAVERSDESRPGRDRGRRRGRRGPVSVGVLRLRQHFLGVLPDCRRGAAGLRRARRQRVRAAHLPDRADLRIDDLGDATTGRAGPPPASAPAAPARPPRPRCAPNRRRGSAPPPRPSAACSGAAAPCPPPACRCGWPIRAARRCRA